MSGEHYSATGNQAPVRLTAAQESALRLLIDTTRAGGGPMRTRYTTHRATALRVLTRLGYAQAERADEFWVWWTPTTAGIERARTLP